MKIGTVSGELKGRSEGFDGWIVVSTSSSSEVLPSFHVTTRLLLRLLTTILGSASTLFDLPSLSLSAKHTTQCLYELCSEAMSKDRDSNAILHLSLLSTAAVDPSSSLMPPHPPPTHHHHHHDLPMSMRTASPPSERTSCWTSSGDASILLISTRGTIIR